MPTHVAVDLTAEDGSTLRFAAAELALLAERTLNEMIDVEDALEAQRMIAPDGDHSALEAQTAALFARVERLSAAGLRLMTLGNTVDLSIREMPGGYSALTQRARAFVASQMTA